MHLTDTTVTGVIVGAVMWIGNYVHTRQVFGKLSGAIGEFLTAHAKPTAQAIVNEAKVIAHEPVVLGVEAELKHKLDAESARGKAAVMRLTAQTHLAAFGGVLAQLRPVEEVVLTQMIQDTLNSYGFTNVSKDEITGLLHEVESTVSNLSNDPNVVQAKKLADDVAAKEASSTSEATPSA